MISHWFHNHLKNKKDNLFTVKKKKRSMRREAGVYGLENPLEAQAAMFPEFFRAGHGAPMSCPTTGWSLQDQLKVHPFE